MPGARMGGRSPRSNRMPPLAGAQHAPFFFKSFHPADLAPIVAELRAAGITSLNGIAAAPDERGIPTPAGSVIGMRRKSRGYSSGLRGKRGGRQTCETAKPALTAS
jgi:hypothetical protein